MTIFCLCCLLCVNKLFWSIDMIANADCLIQKCFFMLMLHTSITEL